MTKDTDIIWGDKVLSTKPVQAIASGSGEIKPILSIEENQVRREEQIIGKIERVEILDGKTINVQMRITDKKTLREIQQGKHPTISIGSNRREES